MESARNVGGGFSPLDEELELSPGSLTPHAHECLVRFGAWMPFGKAAGELAFSLRVKVSEPTARRYAEGGGRAYVKWQTKEVERLEVETPRPPAGADKMLFSMDGAMVPLVGGEWAEVKTLVIGEIEKPVREGDEWVVHSREHSYFSRLADADAFCRLSLVETHRRGIERAGKVAAVSDGAEWEQKMIDFHCSQATRILDFPHAGERIWQIGQAIWGEESQPAKTWGQDQLHSLKHAGPLDLLAELNSLQQQQPTLEVLQKNLAYLEKRVDHMQYPNYSQQGLPIASGAVESGNKVVVEARLKGAGMHWARPNVDPLLGLRNILCSDRWNEDWKQIASALRQTQTLQRQAIHLKHQPVIYPSDSSQPIAIPVEPHLLASSLPPSPASFLSHENPLPKSSIPAPNHPWRHSPIGKAKFWSADHFAKN
jgi:hypothetical protein